MNKHIQKNQNINFSKDLRKAETIVESKIDEKSFLKDLELIISSINRFKSENPEITKKEMEIKLLEEFRNFFKPIFDLRGYYDKYILNLCYKYLKKNPDKKAELLLKIKAEKITSNSTQYFLTNEGKFETQLIRYLLSEKENVNYIIEQIREILKRNPFLNEYIENDRKLRPSEIQSISTKLRNSGEKSAEIEQTIQYINIYNGNYEIVSEQIKKHREDTIKQDLVKFILSVYMNLEKLGYIDRYREIQKENYNLKGFEEFVQDENIFDYKDSNAQEILLKCSIENLMALASFWMNRYEKALEGYANAFFAILDLDCIQEIMENGKLQESINKQFLKEMFLRITMINNKKTEVFNKVVTDLQNVESLRNRKYKQSENGYEYPIENFVRLIQQSYGEEYDEHFVGSDLLNDIYTVINLYNFKDNAYLNKNKLMMAFVASIGLNPQNINAGLIIEENSNNNRSVSKNFVSVGMDTEFNFPIRLHIQKDELIDFLREFNGDTIMPIYEGFEDFSDISAQVVSPFSENQKKILRRKLESIPIGDKSREFFEHLDYLRSRKKVPKHLRNQNGLLRRRYIDLISGDIFVKTKKGYEIIGKVNNGGDRFECR